MEKDSTKINRRNFLLTVGAGVIASPLLKSKNQNPSAEKVITELAEIYKESDAKHRAGIRRFMSSHKFSPKGQKIMKKLNAAFVEVYGL